jgi:hypothetical protein
VIFLLGAILGCLPRFLLALIAMSGRTLHADRRTCAERRASRREARRARREERRAKRAGGVKLDGEVEEVLPAYTDADKIDEKA